jgi:hypothetical protein
LKNLISYLFLAFFILPISSNATNCWEEFLLKAEELKRENKAVNPKMIAAFIQFKEMPKRTLLNKLKRSGIEFVGAIGVKTMSLIPVGLLESLYQLPEINSIRKLPVRYYQTAKD